MKTKDNNNNRDDHRQNDQLDELLEQLAVPAERAEEIARDIRQGDELLQRCSDPPVPADVLERTGAAIAAKLQQERLARQRTRGRLVRRVAAVIILALAATGLLLQMNNNGQLNDAGPSDPTQQHAIAQHVSPESNEVTPDSQRALWEFVLLEQESDYDGESVDDLDIAELRLLLDYAEATEIDSFGKESQDENRYS